MKMMHKDATGSTWSTGANLNFIDLRAPAFLLAPVYTPIRATTPRWGKVNAGYGTQPQWKAITTFDSGNTFPGVSEGNRNAYSAISEKDFSAPYVTLGTDDFVTYEGVSASEGYEDMLGTSHQVQLLRFLNMQEKTYLLGMGTGTQNAAALQLGTTNTPTLATATLPTIKGGTGLTTTHYFGMFCVALNARAADQYRSYIQTNRQDKLNVATSAATVPTALSIQYTRTNADGSTDVINTGSGKVSLASAAVLATTGALLAKVTEEAGAFAYAWFAQDGGTSTFTPAAASATLVGITAEPAFVYYGQGSAGTQTASALSADWSTNALDEDGIFTIASNTNYTSGLPQPAYVKDLHGAGLTNGGAVGVVTELQSALYQLALLLVAPTAIYLSTDMVDSFTQAFMVGATTSPQLNFFAPVGRSKALSIPNGVADYFDRFAVGSDNPYVPVIHHPYLPVGTVLIDVSSLGVAYQHSRVGETRGVFVRRDTYGQEFARTSRKYPFGVYSEERLAYRTPHMLAVLKGGGAFGQAALF
jgi:hypothetical protein